MARRASRSWCVLSVMVMVAGLAGEACSSSGSSPPPAPRAARGAGALARRLGSLAKKAAVAKIPAVAGDAGARQPGHLCRRPNDPVPPRYQEIVGIFEKEVAGGAIPGAAMAILEHGHLAFAYGTGTKGAYNEEPVCPSTLFRIGSMTKALTATALLHLADEKKVALDEKLLTLAPDVTLPSGTELSSLTLRQLLAQESGVVNILNFSGPTDDAYLSGYLTGQDFASAAYFMNPPGAFFNYSNTNYMLAGLAIERAGGLAYPDAVRRYVTGPLRMDRSTFLPSDVLADGDYTNGLGTNADGTPWDIAPDAYDDAATRPAGMEFSSVLDFARFAEFVYAGNERVLSAQSWNAMQSSQVNADTVGNASRYGYGLYVDTATAFSNGAYYPGKRIQHTGGQPGWASLWDLYPEQGFGLIVFQNSESGNEFEGTLEYAVKHFVGLRSVAEPAGVAIAPREFRAYAGTYYDPCVIGTAIVTDTRGALAVSLPDLDAAGIPYDAALVPTFRDSFTMTIEGFAVDATFIRDSSGKFAWLRGFEGFAAARVEGDGGVPECQP